VAYQKITLAELRTLVRARLHSATFWTDSEIRNGLNEGLKLYQVSTGRWRGRFTIQTEAGRVIYDCTKIAQLTQAPGAASSSVMAIGSAAEEKAPPAPEATPRVLAGCSLTPPRTDFPYIVISPTVSNQCLTDTSHGTVTVNSDGGSTSANAGTISRTSTSSLGGQWLTIEWEGFSLPAGVTAAMLTHIYAVVVSDHQVTGGISGVVYHDVGPLPWAGCSTTPFGPGAFNMQNSPNPWTTTQFTTELPLPVDVTTLGIDTRNNSTLNASIPLDLTTVHCVGLMLFGNFPSPTCSLAASATNICVGDPVTITWTSANGLSATLNPGLGTVAANGSVSVKPGLGITTYVLVVTGIPTSAGTPTATCTIAVQAVDCAPAVTGTRIIAPIRMVYQGLGQSPQPLAWSSFADMDFSYPGWQLQSTQTPVIPDSPNIWGPFGGINYFFIWPADVTGGNSLQIDCLLTAPVLVNDTDFLNLSVDESVGLVGYATHMCAFKRGGIHFQESMPLFEQFLRMCASRNSYLKTISPFKEAFGEDSARRMKPRRSEDRTGQEIGIGVR
jgi:hypothetical protein